MDLYNLYTDRQLQLIPNEKRKVEWRREGEGGILRLPSSQATLLLWSAIHWLMFWASIPRMWVWPPNFVFVQHFPLSHSVMPIDSFYTRVKLSANRSCKMHNSNSKCTQIQSAYLLVRVNSFSLLSFFPCQWVKHRSSLFRVVLFLNQIKSVHSHWCVIHCLWCSGADFLLFLNIWVYMRNDPPPLRNILSADVTLSVQCEGQPVVDVSCGAGMVAGLIRVRATAGCQKAERREDPVLTQVIVAVMHRSRGLPLPCGRPAPYQWLWTSITIHTALYTWLWL